MINSKCRVDLNCYPRSGRYTQGLADEGERIHSIVDEMEAEDQTAMEIEEYEGSSDDE